MGSWVLTFGFVLAGCAMVYLWLKQKSWSAGEQMAGAIKEPLRAGRDALGDSLSVSSNQLWRPIRLAILEVQRTLDEASDPVVRGMSESVRSALISAQRVAEQHLLSRDRLKSGLLAAGASKAGEPAGRAEALLQKIDADLHELHASLTRLNGNLRLTGALASAGQFEDEIRDNLSVLRSFEQTAAEATQLLSR